MSSLEEEVQRELHFLQGTWLQDIPLDRTVLLCILVLLTAVVLATSLSILRSFSSKKHPPILPTFPLVGGMLKFADPIGLLATGHKTCGDVFSVRILHRKFTFLIGPEVSSHFFRAPDKDVSQKEVYKFNVPTFGPGVVFDVDYPVRMEQFRFLVDGLKQAKLRSYVGDMVREAEAHFAKWGNEGVIDLKKDLADLIIATASRTLLGREAREQMFEKVSDLLHDLDQGMLPISFFFPYLPIPAHKKRDEANKELRRLFSTVIANRRAAAISENDLLQVFIDATYKSSGRHLTDGEITGLLIAALFAGQHTSSVTSLWVSAHLCSEPKWLAQVVEEQKRIIAEHGTELNFDVLSKMDDLYLVIKETLRLHPPLMLLMRYVHSDFNVTTAEGTSYVIPKGHVVITSPYYSHRLERIYRDANSFDPERFTPGREEDKVGGAYSYIAFGGGRHGCLGENFGYMQIKAIWSVMIRNFELELISPFPGSDFRSFVVGPTGSCTFRYKRRATPFA
eukprot:TRINITY_DN23035_c0_g1_i1.p1 TRINITY_DN23035_c0_g1~~TRINITY_DN23035_c0_g1_i1.p1  ORF type:complete len:508 (-),score=80.12 TRINITY_DN23035_c0_g1_i1:9-1532(-)